MVNKDKKSSVTEKSSEKYLTTKHKVFSHDMSVDSSMSKEKLLFFMYSNNSSLLAAPITFFISLLPLVGPHFIFFAMLESGHMDVNSFGKCSRRLND